MYHLQSRNYKRCKETEIYLQKETSIYTFSSKQVSGQKINMDMKDLDNIINS